MASEDVDPMIVTAIDIHESTSICIADLQSPPVAPSFTIFNKLPVEIREMIWELACSEPRVFDILPSPFSNAFWCGAPQQGVSVGESGFEEPVSMCSYSRPPALLSVSPEARKVALKYYEPAFEADSSPCGQFKIDGPVKIWIDWKKDLIVPLPVHKEKFDWNFLAKPNIFSKQHGITGNEELNFLPEWSAFKNLSEITIYRIPDELWDHSEFGWGRRFYLRLANPCGENNNRRAGGGTAAVWAVLTNLLKYAQEGYHNWNWRAPFVNLGSSKIEYRDLKSLQKHELRMHSI